jgi:NACalpha-BTF3-like transcription factor
LKAKEVKNMDLENIKKLLLAGDEKVIIVEKGEPVAVLMSFQGYEKTLQSKGNPRPVENYPIEEKKVDNSQENSKIKEDLTVEDLPF